MKLKKGDSVVMHTCIEAEEHEGKIWTCETDETKLSEAHDYNVIWLEGYSGCFMVKYLQRVDLNSIKTMGEKGK